MTKTTASGPTYTLTQLEQAHQGVTLILKSEDDTFSRLTAGWHETLYALPTAQLPAPTPFEPGSAVLLIGSPVHTRVIVPTQLARALEQALSWSYELKAFERVERLGTREFLLLTARPLSGQAVLYTVDQDSYMSVGSDFGLGGPPEEQHGFVTVQDGPSIWKQGEPAPRLLFSASFWSEELFNQLMGPVEPRPVLEESGL